MTQFQLLRVRNKYGSQVTKKGEGVSHAQGVNNVFTFLLKTIVSGEVYKGWWMPYDPEWCRKEKWKKHQEHEYDGALKIIINGRKITFFWEVDGSSHDAVEKKINDGIAEKYAESKGIKVIRLSLTECLGEEADREKYFKKEFGKHFSLK